MVRQTDDQIKADIAIRFADNSTGNISEADARVELETLVDSKKSVFSNEQAVDVQVDSAEFNQNLSPADNTLQKALATLDKVMASGGDTPVNPPVTGVFTYGVADAINGNVALRHNFSTGVRTTINMPSVTDGQFYVFVLPTGFIIQDIVNVLNFHETPTFTRNLQRWTQGPLNAGGVKQYRVTIVQGS